MATVRFPTTPFQYSPENEQQFRLAVEQALLTAGQGSDGADGDDGAPGAQGPAGDPLTGMVDPTAYGYVTGDTDIQPTALASSWAALQAACFACYNEEASGTATGGSTTTLVDATATFSATLDDRIDAGAGNDFSHEVVFLSGNNKGRYSNVDVRDSATQLTLSPALPNAVAATDEYRILKSSRTQTRAANKVLWLPPGRAKIDEEVTAIRGTSSFCVKGGGMGVSFLDFSLTSRTLAPAAFDSATATTLTKAGAFAGVDYTGRFAWTWNNADSRIVTCFGRITGNTDDAITVERWGPLSTETPDSANETFAIGLRSCILLNGVSNTSIGEFVFYAGASSDAGNQMMMGLAYHWLRVTNTLASAEDRVAFSNSQNTIYHVNGEGRVVQALFRYGNYHYAASNQVDNAYVFGCKWFGRWEPGVSTDQRYSKSTVFIGDGTAGNSLITTFVGGAAVYGQDGFTVGWQDVMCIGMTMQSNGDTSLNNSSGIGLGDIHIVGVQAYAGFYGCRSEGSSRFITSHTNSIYQQLEIVQCNYHIGSNAIFADDGHVIHLAFENVAFRIGGLWIYGEDPSGFASPRSAKCYVLRGKINCEALACVGSDVHTFFQAGLSAPVRIDYYAKLNSGNVATKTWIGGLFLRGENTPAVAEDQWHWEGVCGVAPDVSHGRSSAGVYRYNQGLLAQVPHALGSSITIPTEHSAIYGRRMTLASTERLTLAGTSRVALVA